MPPDHLKRNGLLLYGFDRETNALVDVRSSSVRKGKACDAICPECHCPLVAAKGDQLQHHFKHKPADNGEPRECSNPDGARESIVHELTKQIISEMQSAYVRSYLELFSDYRGHRIPPFKVFDVRELPFKDIEIEPPRFLATDSLKPDLLIKGDVNFLAIEVMCSHASSEKKIARFKELNWFALEVDMSDVNPSELGKTLIEQRLQDSRYSKWLSRPHNDKVDEKARQHHQQHINRIDAIFERQEVERAEQSAKEEAERNTEARRIERERQLVIEEKEKERRLLVEGKCTQKAHWYYAQHLKPVELDIELTRQARAIADLLDSAYLG